MDPTFNDSQRRWNPILGHWVVVSPNRIKRPWSGAIENDNKNHEVQNDTVIAGEIDITNPLAPRAKRDSGLVNADYKSVYTFENDFPALQNEASPVVVDDHDDDELFRVQPALGKCLVMCYHPASNLSLVNLTDEDVQRVIAEWARITDTYRNEGSYKWIQIFENHGSIVGCSNPHPHCQIWVSKFLPTLPDRMDRNLRDYYNRHQKNLLVDYMHKEKMKNSLRHVCSNDDWIVFTPFWAQWPFETILLPKKRSLKYLDDLNASEIESLALIMKDLLSRYDRLFNCDFPFCFSWYQAPLDHSNDGSNEHWLLHGVWYPPLLRSVSVKKFVAGYELFAEYQRDMTPELAAEKLRQSA